MELRDGDVGHVPVGFVCVVAEGHRAGQGPDEGNLFHGVGDGVGEVRQRDEDADCGGRGCGEFDDACFCVSFLFHLFCLPDRAPQLCHLALRHVRPFIFFPI